MTDAEMDRLLNAVDDIARDHNHYEYGLPVFCDEVMARMRGAVRAFVAELEAERNKLQAFKDYTHTRLDAAGVPADPDSPHRAEGCRIGGRLDAVFAERDALRAALARVNGAARVAADANVCGCEACQEAQLLELLHRKGE